MKTTPVLALAILLTLGCSPDEPKQQASTDAQIAYSERLKQHEDLIEKARKTGNDAIEKKAENDARDFLKAMSVTATNWKATAEKIRSSKDGTEIIAKQKNHTYTMRIVDPSLNDWTSTLKSGDQIIFSGDIGKERSITASGGLRNPEFTFFPASIKLASESNNRLQSSESIANAIKLDEVQAKQELIIGNVDALCEDAIRSAAFNKRAADFSILERKIVQINDDTWNYANDVTLQNAFGAKVTYRATCKVKTRIGPSGNLQAMVVSRKIYQ